MAEEKKNSAKFFVRKGENHIFAKKHTTMNAILQKSAKNFITSTQLEEKGYMTLEQSKAIISKKIQEHFHK